MPTDWQDLLTAAGVGGLSRGDVIGQLVAVSRAESGSASATNSTPTGAASTGVSDVAGGLAQESNREVSQQMASLTGQLSNLGASQQTQTGAIQDNTQAVTQNTVSKGSSGDSVAKQVGSVAEGLLGGALGLSPIISGIMSLFTGHSSSTVTPITPFTLPPPVQYQAGLVSGAGSTQVAPVSFGEGGQPRPQASAQATQVTVQVNAIDSRSFLDHSDEIASALKEALLNSNSLKDVITEL